MSDDLVTRLRDCTHNAHILGVCMEAADRIEELETELRETQDHANALAAKEYYTEIHAERAEALAKAIRVVELICGPDWEDRLEEKIDLGCEVMSLVGPAAKKSAPEAAAMKGQDDE